MYLNVIHNLSWLNILREGGSLKKLKSVIDAYYSGGVQFQMELDWFVLPFSRLSYAWRSYPAQEHTVPLPTLGAMMSSRDHLAWLYSGLTMRPMNKIAPDVLWQIMKRNGWSTQRLFLIMPVGAIMTTAVAAPQKPCELIKHICCSHVCKNIIECKLLSQVKFWQRHLYLARAWLHRYKSLL